MIDMKRAKAVYDAQGTLLNLITEEMYGTLEHRAMARVLFRLDQEMFELCPGLAATPKDPLYYLQGLLNEWYQFNRWCIDEAVYEEKVSFEHRYGDWRIICGPIPYGKGPREAMVDMLRTMNVVVRAYTYDLYDEAIEFPERPGFKSVGTYWMAVEE